MVCKLETGHYILIEKNSRININIVNNIDLSNENK